MICNLLDISKVLYSYFAIEIILEWQRNKEYHYTLVVCFYPLHFFFKYQENGLYHFAVTKRRRVNRLTFIKTPLGLINLDYKDPLILSPEGFN